MTVDLNSKILKQVEFYFGDANLPRDKFLRERVQESEEGWVSLGTVASFARMKALTEDMEAIKEALSAPSEVIVLNEDKTCIRRLHPIPEQKDTLERTLYVKGFPQTATLDELQAFFAQHTQSVQAIRFRRHKPSGAFKGSVFVEFANEEEAKKFASLEVAYEGEQTLVVKSKMAYLSEKNAELMAKKSKPSGTDNEKKAIPNRLMKIMDFPAQGVTPVALKQTLQDTFPVAYADFTFEPGCAWIRFTQPVASDFVATYGTEKPLEIGEHKLTQFVIPAEEEEQKYWVENNKAFDAKKRNSKQNRQQQYNSKRKIDEEAIADGTEDSKKAKTAEEEEETAAAPTTTVEAN